MFEVWCGDVKIAAFLYKSDAEMFIRATGEKLPDMAAKYVIKDVRAEYDRKHRKIGIFGKIKKFFFFRIARRTLDFF